MRQNRGSLLQAKMCTKNNETLKDPAQLQTIGIAFLHLISRVTRLCIHTREKPRDIYAVFDLTVFL